MSFWNFISRFEISELFFDELLLRREEVPVRLAAVEEQVAEVDLPRALLLRVVLCVWGGGGGGDGVARGGQEFVRRSKTNRNAYDNPTDEDRQERRRCALTCEEVGP